MEASSDLGAFKWATLRRVVFPLSDAWRAFRDSAALIPSLSLHVDPSHRWEPGHYLGAAVEHFMITQNRRHGFHHWGRPHGAHGASRRT